MVPRMVCELNVHTVHLHVLPTQLAFQAHWASGPHAFVCMWVQSLSQDPGHLYDCPRMVSLQRCFASTKYHQEEKHT
jgi:hypothetical protein